MAKRFILITHAMKEGCFLWKYLLGFTREAFDWRGPQDLIDLLQCFALFLDFHIFPAISIVVGLKNIGWVNFIRTQKTLLVDLFRNFSPFCIFLSSKIFFGLCNLLRRWHWLVIDLPVTCFCQELHFCLIVNILYFRRKRFIFFHNGL